MIYSRKFKFVQLTSFEETKIIGGTGIVPAGGVNSDEDGFANNIPPGGSNHEEDGFILSES